MNVDFKFSYLLVLLFISPLFSFAQNNELGSWNIINLKYKFNKKINVFAEGQIRSLGFYNNYHYYEYKGGIDYKPNQNIKLTLGIGDYNTYSEGGNFKSPLQNDEMRIWPQVTLYQTFGKFKIEQRYRLEMRFNDGNYKSRFRYRLGIAKQLNDSKAKKPVNIGFYNEIFFTNKEPYFVRNRITGQVSYKFHQYLSVLLGYVHQFDYKINDETGKDFLQFGLFIDLN